MALLTQMLRHEGDLTPVQLQFLMVLVKLVEGYEKARFPFDMPTPQELAEFRLEQQHGELGKCPWCGETGYGFAESGRPSDYCGHDPALVRKPDTAV